VICDQEVMGSSLNRVLLHGSFGQVIYTYGFRHQTIWYWHNGWEVKTRCTSPISVVSQCKQTGAAETKVSAA